MHYAAKQKLTECLQITYIFQILHFYLESFFFK